MVEYDVRDMDAAKSLASRLSKSDEEIAALATKLSSLAPQVMACDKTAGCNVVVANWLESVSASLKQAIEPVKNFVANVNQQVKLAEDVDECNSQGAILGM